LWNNDKKDESLYYMLEINEDAYSVKYNYQDIGYLIGLKIIKLDEHYDLKEKFYLFLLEKYKESVDIPVILFELSENYKKQFDIKNAVKVIEKLLKIAKPSELADNRIDLKALRDDVVFYYSSKKWIDKDIESHVKKIKYAIRKRNRQLLTTYVSKTNFRVGYFKEKAEKSKSYYDLAIHRWWNNSIYFESEVESFSTDSEIYLRSTYWTLPQMKEWYFYFKKVDYPYDSDIDGGWEWAGIYFGNWL